MSYKIQAEGDTRLMNPKPDQSIKKGDK